MGLRDTRALLAVLTATALTTAAIAIAPAAPVLAADVASTTCAAPAPGGAVSDRRLESYRAITPVRLVDTRDGTGGVARPLGDGCTLRIDLDETVAPAGVRAVSLSVTAISAKAGYLTVFPCAAGLPDTSNVNPRAGFPTPNLVVATPDQDGRICISTLFRSDVVVDLAGWWEAGSNRFRSITPVRAIDTRVDDPALEPADTEIVVPVTGGDVPTDATAASVNLTVTSTAGDGFLVAYPCGRRAPLASNLNFRMGESRAVAAIVGLGDGAVCVRSNVDLELIVDVNGAYAPAPQFGPAAGLHPLAGRRIASTRDGIGGWSGRFTPGLVRSIDPVVGLPTAPEATAVTVNITTLDATTPGYVSAYPCGGPPPEVSSVNFVPGTVSTNLVTVDLGGDGRLCVFASTTVNVIVDLFGVMAAPDGALVERLTPDGHTWPPFTPAGTDYAVECGTDNRLALEIEPVPGAAVRVNGLTVAPGDVSVRARTDDLVRVDLAGDGASRTYWLRCLPTDFPRLTVSSTGGAAPGWYLTTLWGPAAGGSGFASFTVILDERGAPVWYKRTDTVVIDLKRRADGRLVYTPQLGNAFGVDPDSGYRITSLSGTLIDEHLTSDAVAFPVDHHDYVSLPNGGRAMLSYPLVRNRNLTVLGAGYFNNESIVDGVIEELNAAGQRVWAWRVDDHFGYGEATFPVRFGLYPGEPHGGEVDPWHLNSLQRVDDGSGDYVLSARHLDAIIRVDRATAEVDWILGSLPVGTPNESGAPRLQIVGDPLGGPRRPHHARLTGNVLTLLDNRTNTGQPARAVAYRIDAGAGTATLLWQISNPGGASSPGLGSTQLLSDGSVVVNWGGGVQPMFQQFDPDGDPVLTISQVGGASYRFIREPVSSFDRAVLRANGGGAAEAPG